MATHSSITLHDGRQVSICSEDWRHECEARHILAMATRTQRRAYLDGVDARRGEAERKRLERTMLSLWKKV